VKKIKKIGQHLPKLQ